MRAFKDYLDHEQRKVIRQLKIVQKVLEHAGMKTEDFTDLNDPNKQPFIFCLNTSGTKFFDGVRIYSIGDKLAYRVQKESQTHPFGRSYPLYIPEIFNDFLNEEGADPKKAGHKVIEEVPNILRRFFERSAQAEVELQNQEIRDKQDNNFRSTTGTDYSSIVSRDQASGGNQ